MASPPHDNRRKKTGEDDVVDDGAKTIKLWGVEIPIGRDDGGHQAPVNIHSSSSSTAAGTHHHQEIPEVLEDDVVDGSAKSIKLSGVKIPIGRDDVVKDGAKTIKLWGVKIPIGRDGGGDQAPVNIHSSSTAAQEIPEVETIFPAGNLIDQDLMKNKSSSSTRSADEGSSSSSSATTGNIIARTPIKLPPLRPMGGGFPYPSLFRKKLIRGDIRRLKVPNVDGFWDSLQFALTEEEKAELKKKDGFVRVSASASDAITNTNYQLHLSTVPQKSVAYVLGHQWRKLLKHNQLTLGDTVEARAYRKGEGNLHLQLTFTKEQKSELETELESCSITRSCFCR